MELRPAPTASGEEEAARLTVRLLGPWDAQSHGQPLRSLRSRKGEWLLALLLLQNGGAVEREWLAGLLWPESDRAKALFNLRRNLTDLRQALGPEAERLETPAPRTLRLDATGADVDLHRFDAAIARAGGAEGCGREQIDGAVRAALDLAVRLYRGPLLVECHEAWITPERTAREQAYLGALERLAQDARARGDLEEAARCLRRTVAVDPLREDTQYALMEALAAQGDALAGTLVFREYSLRLHRELNSAPGPEISALFQQLRAQTRARSRQSMNARRRSGAPTEAAGGLPPLLRPPPPTRQGSRVGDQGSVPVPFPTPDPRPLTPASHLPRPVSSFVGRDQEAAEIASALAAARLVTLTGAGGVGKTRLAIRVGEQLALDYPDGIWFVELAGLAAGAELDRAAQSAARVLGVSEQPNRPLIETVCEWLQPKRLLLILDNCEHVLDAAARLAASLLESCPELRVLATSRQSLGVIGEVVWRVPPLSVPGGQAVRPIRIEHEHDPNARTPDRLIQFEAVCLFVERGRAVNREFALTAENASAVAAVCRRLEGLPLAIELAAARLKALTVEEIAHRLAGALRARLRLLTGGSRAAPTRQQTLEAAIDWSYDLLSEVERALFRQLSVFAGGFTLEAVEAVCGDFGFRVPSGRLDFGLATKSMTADDRTPLPDPIQNPNATPTGHAAPETQNDEVLDLLTSLVDQSLVQVEGSRFRLLETLREYAASRLTAEERQAVARRHGQYYLSVAEATVGRWVGAEWMERLEREHDNLRAAFDWAVGQKELESSLRLGSALGPFWSARGYWQEGRHRLAAILAGAAAGPPLPPPLQIKRAHVLDRAAELAQLQNDDAAARELYEAALAIYREQGDRLGAAWGCVSVGNMARRCDEYETARMLLSEALALFRELEDPPGIAGALRCLGELAEDEGGHASARTFYQQSLVLWEELDDSVAVLRVRTDLGRLAYLEGERETAKTLFRETLTRARELGIQVLVTFALYLLGSLARLEEDYALAAAYHREGLALYRELEDTTSIAGSLAALASALHFQAESCQATAFFQEALQINRKLGNRRQIAHCLEGLAGIAAGAGCSGVQAFGSPGPQRPIHPLCGYPNAPSTRCAGTRTHALLTAARLFGAAAVLRKGDSPRWPADQADYERNLAALRARLDAEALAAAWAEGRAMALDEAVALALGEMEQP